MARGPAIMLLALTVALPVAAEEPVLRLRAVIAGEGAPGPLTIELFRWSTDAERAPLLTALAPPPPPPAAAAAGADGPGRAGRAGRGGRGGRGGAAPPSPAARLTTAVKGAPTLGFIWGDGVTGYSIKYAWRGPSAAGSAERIVFVTDRRLGAHTPGWAPGASGAAPDAEFTVIEMHLDSKGPGVGKTSLATAVVVDKAAQTLALDGYEAAPALLTITR